MTQPPDFVAPEPAPQPIGPGFPQPPAAASGSDVKAKGIHPLVWALSGIAVLSLAFAAVTVGWTLIGPPAVATAAPAPTPVSASPAPTGSPTPITVPVPDSVESATPEPTTTTDPGGSTPAGPGLEGVPTDVSMDLIPLGKSATFFSDSKFTITDAASVVDDLPDVSHTVPGTQFVVVPCKSASADDALSALSLGDWLFATTDRIGFPINVEATGATLSKSGKVKLVFEVPAGDVAGWVTYRDIFNDEIHLRFDVGLA